MGDDEESTATPRLSIGSLLEWHIATSSRAAEAVWNLCIVLAAVLVTIVSAQVFTRYVLGFVPLWGGELARYLGIWLALLLMGALVRLDRHLQVEIVYRRYSLRTRRIIRSIQLGLIIILGWLMFEWGLMYALNSGTGQQSPSMGFQMIWVYLILPISGLLLIYFASAKIAQINKDPETIDRDYEARFRVDGSSDDSSPPADQDTTSDHQKETEASEVVDRE